MAYYNTATKMKKLLLANPINAEFEKEVNEMLVDTAIEEGRLSDLLADFPELYNKYIKRRK